MKDCEGRSKTLTSLSASPSINSFPETIYRTTQFGHLSNSVLTKKLVMHCSLLFPSRSAAVATSHSSTLATTERNARDFSGDSTFFLFQHLLFYRSNRDYCT